MGKELKFSINGTLKAFLSFDRLQMKNNNGCHVISKLLGNSAKQYPTTLHKALQGLKEGDFIGIKKFGAVQVGLCIYPFSLRGTSQIHNSSNGIIGIIVSGLSSYLVWRAMRCDSSLG